MASAEDQEDTTPEQEISVEIITPEENIENWVKDFSNYKEVMVLLDNSPSMTTEKNIMADKMADSDNGKTAVRVAYFSDKLHEVGEENNIQEAAKYLKTVPNSGSSLERMVDAMIAAVETFAPSDNDSNTEEKKLLIAGTDEAFQRVSKAKLDKLHKLAEERGVDINILFAQRSSNGDRVHANIKLSNLEDGSAPNYDKLKASCEKSIIKYNKIINNPKAEKKHVKNAKKCLSTVSERLNTIYDREFTIREIKLDNGQKINLPTF